MFAKIKNYGRAEKMLRHVAELNPSYLDKAIFNLAMVQLKQGKKRESHRCHRGAGRIDDVIGHRSGRWTDVCWPARACRCSGQDPC